MHHEVDRERERDPRVIGNLVYLVPGYRVRYRTGIPVPGYRYYAKRLGGVNSGPGVLRIGYARSYRVLAKNINISVDSSCHVMKKNKRTGTNGQEVDQVKFGHTLTSSFFSFNYQCVKIVMQ